MKKSELETLISKKSQEIFTQMAKEKKKIILIILISQNPMNLLISN